ncbi:MAG: transglutaminase family protein [Promethearchaeota archaeon]
MKEYLKPTEFFDFDKKKVSDKAFKIINGVSSEKEKAIALFYWVRDQIKYNMYTYRPKEKKNFKASVTLQRANGFCMSKAILLTTLARAVGIPARIHMVDIINHKIPDWIEKLMGTKTFHCHGYSEQYIDGKWRKLTPVFDKKTAIKAGYVPLVEFDGENDALLAPIDEKGNLFVEYVKDWGIYTDVPLDKINDIFIKNYGKIYTKYEFKKPNK